MANRSLALFGAHGRVGQAIAGIAKNRGIRVEAMGWPQSSSDHYAEAISACLARIEGRVDIIFAGGLTNPSLSQNELTQANVSGPISVIEATKTDPRYRYLTLGSILETIEPLAMGNRYLTSKAILWRHVRKLASDSSLRGRIAHLRGHTFYGGEPARHSFLGQLYESLRAGITFPMSNGLQLREYMHVQDAAYSVLALLDNGCEQRLDYDLSTGEPVKLSSLANAVFKAFDREQLLHVGALDTPQGETEIKPFPRAPDWLLGQPRPSVAGIIEWLKSLLKP